MGVGALCVLLLLVAPVNGAAAKSPVATPHVAAKAPAEPDTVLLAFAWPVGLRANVTSVRKHTRILQSKSTRSMTSRYTMEVAADTGGLRIRCTDPKVELGAGFEALPAAARAQAVDQAADFFPEFRVNETGECTGLVDLPGFQAKLQDFLASIFPKGTDSIVVAQARSLMGSEAFANAKASEQWNSIVGTWVGAEMEVGEEYPYSNREAVALFPGQDVLMHFTFAANRLLPCSRRGSQRPCVELELHSVADAEDMKKVIDQFFQKLGRGASSPSSLFTSLEIENVIRLVTEPKGLIPHRMTVTRTLQGTVRVEGKDFPIEQTDETQVEYAYP